MSDTETAAPEKPARSPWWGVQRFVYSMGLLAIFWLVFGQVLPPLLFGQEPAPPAPPVAEPVADIAPAPVVVEDIAPSRLALIEEKLATQEAEIASLKAALKTQAPGKEGPGLAALVAYGQLKDALLRGEAYSAPLEQLKKITAHQPPAQDALAPLARWADKGVATPAALAARFTALIPQALAGKDDDHFTRGLRALVSVRKTGEPVGADDEAILARGETRLAGGDVAQALHELSGLSADAKDALAAWRTDAQALLEARTQLDALQLTLTQEKPGE